MLTLSKLKQHLTHKGITTLPEISITFGEERSVVEMMLQHFINKGQLKICRKTPKCGTQCNQCTFAETSLYEWVSQAS